MIIRIFVAAAALLAIQGAVLFVRDRGMPTEPAVLEMKLDDLPLSLSGWKGEPVQLDPEIFKAVGATVTLDRSYRDRQGRVVTMQIAVFDKREHLQGINHPPELCYSTHGWHLDESKPQPLGPEGAAARVFSAENQGKHLSVLYWYQIDGNVFFTGDRQRQLILATRGRATRPPVIKVMLDTSAANAEAGEQTLKEFASAVFDWTRGFH